jgi:hypothetical protein
MDIDFIHGDSLVSKKQQTLSPAQVTYSFKALFLAYPRATKVELGFMLNKAVYRFNVDQKKVLISALDGKQLSPINEQLATSIAKDMYNGKSVAIANIQLLIDEPPGELSGRHLPVWRIDFDDFINTSFYIGENSGQLVTKRHSYWRLFDWMFLFHVMDYIDGEVDNKLLLLFTALAFIASIFGLILTYFRLISSRLKQRSRKLERTKWEAGNGTD